MHRGGGVGAEWQTYIRNSDKVASEQNLDFKLRYLRNQVTMKIIVRTLSAHFWACHSLQELRKRWRSLGPAHQWSVKIGLKNSFFLISSKIFQILSWFWPLTIMTVEWGQWFIQVILPIQTLGCLVKKWTLLNIFGPIWECLRKRVYVGGILCTPSLNDKIDSEKSHLQDLARWWRTSKGVDIPKISQFYWALFEKTRFLCFYIIKSSKKRAKIEPKYP